MNMNDLTLNQLKRAVAIKEQIEALNQELRSILGGTAKTGSTSNETGSPVKLAARAKKKNMSAAARAKLSAKLKAFWAAKRAAAGKKTIATKPAKPSAKPAAKAKKTKVSAATRAKLSAKLKAFWATKRAAKK